ncbi:MAG: hypothetical protein Q8K92_21255 [Leadbetterella sp.]|jgi:hypothetical protein|nr:hypothetical protein [Leadbetterella sp.]
MNIILTLFESLSSMLSEPMTSLTDLLLSISCFYFFFGLQKFNEASIGQQHWQKFFLFLGFSTLLGALAHGIFERQNNLFYNSVWLIMQISAGISIFYAQAAAFGQLSNLKVRKLMISLSVLQFVIFLPSVFYFFDFRVVAFNSLIAMTQMIVVFFPSKIENWVYKTYISFGFFISFLTIYVHSQKLSFSKWFNHNDISHLIMYVSILLIFRGIKYQCKTQTTD